VTSCTGVTKLGQGRQGSLDAAIIGDDVAVERHVEVTADDDTLAANLSRQVHSLIATVDSSSFVVMTGGKKTGACQQTADTAPLAIHDLGL
jgi:hypothetical protein